MWDGGLPQADPITAVVGLLLALAVSLGLFLLRTVKTLPPLQKARGIGQTQV